MNLKYIEIIHYINNYHSQYYSHSYTYTDWFNSHIYLILNLCQIWYTFIEFIIILINNNKKVAATCIDIVWI